MEVLNFYKIGKVIPEGTVYIGRANSKFGLPESKYHNPFKIDEASGDTRDVVVDIKYRKHLYTLIREGIITEDELIELGKHDVVCYCAPQKCHGDILKRASVYFTELRNNRKISFDRFGGYQVNTTGDKRYSPFIATVRDGRTIEAIYQCDIKGYDPGGTNWKAGKGKPPLDKTTELFTEYFGLWEEWFIANTGAVEELNEILKTNLYRIGDKFGTTNVNQGLVLSILLNEKFYGHKRLLIAGSRNITLNEDDYSEIKRLYPKISTIVSGGAKGVDTDAIDFATKTLSLEPLIYRPDWNPNGVFDRSAGMKRNKVLFDKSHCAVFFWDGKSTGTKNSLDLFKRSGKEYHVIIR